MGSRSNQSRLHVGILRKSPSIEYFSQNDHNQPRQGRDFGPGNKGSVTEGSNRESGYQNTRVLFNLLRCPKKRRRITSHNKFETVESIHTKENIQNGYSWLNSTKCETKYVDGISRPKRCLFSCTDSKETSPISKIRLPRQGISIQSSTLRPSFRTKGFYKYIRANNSIFTPTIHKDISLPRRSAHYSRVQRRAVSISRHSRHNIKKGRVHNKPEEVSSGPLPRLNLSRNAVQDTAWEGVPTPGQSSCSFKECSFLSSGIIQNGQTVYDDPRSYGSNIAGYTSCKIDDEANTVVLSQKSEVRQASRPESEDSCVKFTASTSTMVDIDDESEKRCSTHSRGTSHNNYDRCLSPSMGRTLSRIQSTRNMESIREVSPYQLFGDVGSVQFSQSISFSDCQSEGVDPNRQYDSNVLHQQTRRYQVTEALFTDLGTMPMVYTTQDSVKSRVYSGSSQCSGRHTIQNSVASDRMAAEQSGIQSDNQIMVGTSDRSVRNVSKQKGSCILRSNSTSNGSSPRCVSNGLERSTGLRLSSNSIITTSIAEDQGQRSNSDIDSSTLASKNLVSPSVRTYSRSTKNSSRLVQSTNSTSRDVDSSQSLNVRPYSLEGKRRFYLEAGISEAAARTIEAATKDSTKTVYLSSWNDFKVWCRRKHLNPSRASIPQIINYLQFTLDKGRALATIRMRVTAISHFHDKMENGQTIAMDETIRLFMRGVRHINPAIRNALPQWSLPTVLTVLMSSPFEPISNISLKNLTLKTAFLVAVCSARRCSEIQALDCRVQFCNESPAGFRLRTNPYFLPKVLSDSALNETISFAPFMPNPQSELAKKLNKVCVVRALHHYLLASNRIRQPGCNQLFVSYKQGAEGFKVSKRRIGVWLQELIHTAYVSLGKVPPKGVRAHDARGQSTSWAEFNNVLPSQICAAATWSNTSTFARHYRLDLASAHQSRHATAVLQSVID